jgi:hypothetical protein
MCSLIYKPIILVEYLCGPSVMNFFEKIRKKMSGFIQYRVVFLFIYGLDNFF